MGQNPAAKTAVADDQQFPAGNLAMDPLEFRSRCGGEDHQRGLCHPAQRLSDLDRIAAALDQLHAQLEAQFPDPAAHPVQQALVAEQAIQCGFCTPGIAMAAAALLARNADPSPEEIAAAVPNLCRCGVYPRLVRAIERAGRVMRRLETIDPVPVPGVTQQDAARTVPAIKAP